MGLLYFIFGLYLGAWLYKERRTVLKPLEYVNRGGSVIGVDEMRKLDHEDLKTKIQEGGRPVSRDELEDL